MGYSPYQLVFFRNSFHHRQNRNESYRPPYQWKHRCFGVVKLTMDNDLKAEKKSMIP